MGQVAVMEAHMWLRYYLLGSLFVVIVGFVIVLLAGEWDKLKNG